MKQWTLVALMATLNVGSMLAEQFTLGMLAASVGAGSFLSDQLTGWTDDKRADEEHYAGDHSKCLECGQPLKEVNPAENASGDSIEGEGIASAK